MSYIVKEDFEENIGMDKSKIGVFLGLYRIVMKRRIDIRKRNATVTGI